jgi:hypothetical protein
MENPPPGGSNAGNKPEMSTSMLNSQVRMHVHRFSWTVLSDILTMQMEIRYSLFTARLLMPDNGLFFCKIGVAYVNSEGQVQPPWEQQRDFQCHCNCASKLTEEEKEELFLRYNDIDNHQQQTVPSRLH